MPSAPLAIFPQSLKNHEANESGFKDNSVIQGKENTITREGSNSGLPPPATPAYRISLSELTANPEDAFNNLPPSATPNDHVTWMHIPGSCHTPSSSVRTTQRGVKRSRSSSPPSASQAARLRKGGGGEGKDGLNLRSLSQSLQRSPSRRSPNHDDPALALWHNYADRRDVDAVLPPMLLIDLSPQTPNGSKSTAGLRRATSCMNDWPTSSSKRRKTVPRDPHSTTRDIFASRKREILRAEIPKQSRVSLLLDSVHQSLANRSPNEPEAPSSSSPLPERYAQWSLPRTNDVEKLATIEEATPFEEPEPGLNAPQVEQNDGSSDYGDLDLDEDDLEAIEEVLTQGPTKAQVNPSKLEPVPNVDHARVLSVPVLDHKRNNPVPTLAAKNDLDEFDDDDDDMLDDELQALAAKVDSQQEIILQAKQHVPERRKSAHSPSGKAKTSYIDLDQELNVENDDDDDDDDDLWKQIEVDAVRPTTSTIGSTNQKNADHRAIQRYRILNVAERVYEISAGRKRPEKVLSIKDEKNKHLYTIRLRQSWYDSRCTEDSYIHLVGSFDVNGQCIVDDKDNMIILHPDHLISATVVADSFTCLRRAVLQDRIKATQPPEKPQVYGHLIHEVFGEALKLNNWEMDSFRRIIEKLLPNYIESLYEIHVSVPEATEHVMSKVSLLKAWATFFVSPSINSEALIRDRNGTLVPMAIDKLLELEEHVWSPMYGLKGNIDATVQTQMQLPTDKVPKTLTIPLELKTGMRDSNEMHRAQTALYTLLLSDRYDLDVTCGVLYYMETCKTFRIERIRNEIRHMIIQRNELAGYIHHKFDLPPMIKKEHLCKKCYAQASCFTYHKLAEGGNAATSGMKEMFDLAVGHLEPTHQAFFQKWDQLLTQEERDCMKFKRELWTMLSTERELVGRCFANVKIEPGSAVEHPNSPKINRFSYSFVKHQPVNGFSFTESQITVGEPIVVSDEKGHFALACGFVTHVRPARITIAVDRKLQDARRKLPGFNLENRQIFTGIMEVGATSGPPPIPDQDTPTLYRIDRDEFANGMATARNNLIRIMDKDLFRARDLRLLIIEKQAPLFKTSPTNYTLSGPASQQNLNVDQRKAIEKVMSARDYALVLGMPGTGKTTTIAHIIRALVSQGKSVLLTSYTHTAVDNILLKIKGDNIPILRLGSVGKVHPDVQSFVDLSGIPKTSVEELERSWHQSKVVATTCLGINQGIFNHRVFDYCIVDEASQITLPVCLGPIRLAKTFILVGDHYQLPPLVQNKEAQEGGLDVSLFKLLSDAQPNAVVSLEHQYRMAEDIMCLSNELIYSGRLKCGTPSVASRSLHIPDLDRGLEAHHHRSSHYLSSQADNHSELYTCRPANLVCTPYASCWLQQTLSPSSRVLFLNTDTISSPTTSHASPKTTSSVGAPETIAGPRITNSTESILIAQLLTVLIRAGVSPRDIGVITFYRSQLALLKRDVKASAGSNAASEVEMHTADKYQGRDKEVILLSCVRSNPENHVGELLRDWRRVNVAITRARSKLIILGSRTTLGNSGVEVLEGLVRTMDREGWVKDLPQRATEGHVFEESMTQTQQTPQKPPRRGPDVNLDMKIQQVPNDHRDDTQKNQNQKQKQNQEQGQSVRPDPAFNTTTATAAAMTTESTTTRQSGDDRDGREKGRQPFGQIDMNSTSHRCGAIARSEPLSARDPRNDTCRGIEPVGSVGPIRSGRTSVENVENVGNVTIGKAMAKFRTPAKTVKGSVDVQRVLDRTSVLRNVVDDVL